jgi:hypothetical protein
MLGGFAFAFAFAFAFEWVWVWARCVSIDTSRKIIPYLGMTLYCDF